jgi:hypothetical protein
MAAPVSDACGVMVTSPKCNGNSVPLEPGGVGRAVLAMQVVGLPQSAQGAEGNWPISHIFSPFLTSSMRDFLTARSQRAHPPSQKICYGGQERPVIPPFSTCGTRGAVQIRRLECGIGSGLDRVLPYQRRSESGRRAGLVRFRGCKKARKDGFGRFRPVCARGCLRTAKVGKRSSETDTPSTEHSPTEPSQGRWRRFRTGNRTAMVNEWPAGLNAARDGRRV